ncbi:activin receptor type-2A [Glossina fuscipes]|uniref:Serine/threonine-protein kinase receptor n=2 Tax=Nemorhina TaxID=44051 RepID=A0A8U0WI53_9MUSC|nr:activin receptor type-2A [Glossina fuscipes]KAI9584893.1 hypothetical protein GQX74_006788 [Glossina fuscipes]
MLQFYSNFLVYLGISMMLRILSLSEAFILPPESHKIDCEFFNETNCTEKGDCATKVEHCETESDKLSDCYVLWSIDKVTGEVHIKMKGCFTQIDDCNQTECVTNYTRSGNYYFCCCRGSMCNTDQRWEPPTTEATTPVPKAKTPEDNDLIYIIICSVILAVLIIITGIGLFLYRRRKQAHFNEIPTNEAEVNSSSPLLSNRPIQLLELKASGRFGDVWQAKLHNQDVAVKIFRMQEKESWNTELEIYKLPRMHHPNILEFLGHEKHKDKMQPEFWLISAYQHNGSLCDYLKSHTISYSELSKIAKTMACGLAHLHEEIPATDTEGLKPSIAHRDFKSKNVLLKADLTACIADFGLAMIFEPGKSCGDTHGQVGTRRYMAPEVLEGAINFNRDAFLKIDVYACGLVLWEMVSRCDAVEPPAEYLLPFEAELGQGPTLEEVQENVVMKKLRPQILNSWRSHSGISNICDTMEECWDHDAEARLSSSCVMERFSQLNKYALTQLLIENNINSVDARDTSSCL